MDRIQEAMASAWRAARNSDDPSTQLGAVLLPRDCAQTIIGWNHLPPGTPPSYWHDRDKKYRRVIHAEEHVVIKAALTGLCTSHATLVCPWACCIRCAGFIIESGISRMVIDNEAMRRSPERWQQEINDAHELLVQNGIEIEGIDFTMKKPVTLFDGKEW